MVIEKYSIEIDSIVESAHLYGDTVLMSLGLFDMKNTSKFYYFEFNSQTDKELFVIVNPQSGEIIEIDKP